MHSFQTYKITWYSIVQYTLKVAFDLNYFFEGEDPIPSQNFCNRLKQVEKNGHVHVNYVLQSRFFDRKNRGR